MNLKKLQEYISQNIKGNASVKVEFVKGFWEEKIKISKQGPAWHIVITKDDNWYQVLLTQADKCTAKLYVKETNYEFKGHLQQIMAFVNENIKPAV